MFTLETDDIIGQYIIFCHVFDAQTKKYGRTREAAMETLRICRDRNVLKDYLNEREKEVVDIMSAIFTQEYAVNQYGNAMKQEGRNELAQLLKKLLSLGKGEEVEKVINDTNYMQKLLKEYSLVEG